MAVSEPPLRWLLFAAPSTALSQLPAGVAGTAPAEAAEATVLSCGVVCSTMHGVAAATRCKRQYIVKALFLRRLLSPA